MDVDVDRDRERPDMDMDQERELISVCSSLDERCSSRLFCKLHAHLQQVSGACVVFLIPLLKATDEALVIAIGDAELNPPLRLPVSDDAIQKVVSEKRPSAVDVSSLDRELREQLGKDEGRVLMIPVNDATGNVAVVAAFVDPPDVEDSFAKIATHVERLFNYCLALVVNTVLGEEEARLKNQCQKLLRIARRLFEKLGDLDVLLRGIMSEARRLTSAERCSLFLIESETGDLVAKVFDSGDASPSSCTEPPLEVRIRRGQGIAGNVAETGKLLNIRNVYEHPLFYKGLDEKTGFTTRNILCFPIKDENGIIGVAQLCNKLNGKYFDACDEEAASAFSMYCGISIMHSIVYKKILDAQARTKISNEMLMYHLKVSDREVNKLLSCKKSHDRDDFESLQFNPRTIDADETVCFVLRMFDNLDFHKRFHIKKDTLARFVLFCQRGYRDMPYHNWIHAFSVAHFAFCAIINFRLMDDNYLTDLECLSYLVSCLCHDLDHRGTNNSFEIKGGSLLASLYSSEGSVMERHHFSQALCILNTDDCNILQNLSSTDYDKCLQLIRDCILATDLANHFKHFDSYSQIFENGLSGYNKEDGEHRLKLLQMLMTCADLADQTKDWECVKKVAAAVYTEFFHQGDEEKQLGLSPLEMMDREKAFIPDLQIQFLDNITIPVYRLLSSIFQISEGCLKAMEEHVKKWRAARKVFSEVGINGGYNLLTSSTLDTSIKDAIDKSEAMET